MSKSTIAIPFVFLAVFFVYAEKSLNLFTILNWVPLISAFFALSKNIQKPWFSSVPALTFSIVATFIPTMFHLAWMFDWQGTATGSSTSGIAYIFVPIWTLLVAAFTSAIAWGIVNLVRRFIKCNPK